MDPRAYLASLCEARYARGQVESKQAGCGACGSEEGSIGMLRSIKIGTKSKSVINVRCRYIVQRKLMGRKI